MKSKIKVLPIAFTVIALIVAIGLGGNSFENVETGQYKVLTKWGTGTMSAKMTPGFMWQFGTIAPMPVGETFFFTAGKHEGENYDQSIPIVFADLSGCDASGTLRIDLPTSESQAISLMRDQNYVTYKDVEQKLVLPIVRKALNATAKLMTARESAGERYNEFISHAVYQIDNGLYVTESVERQIEDASGEYITIRVQEIQYAEDGVTPLTTLNPLAGTGIRVTNFEIEKFKYADVVIDQIAQQQKAVMAVATKKLEAQEAEQEKIKITALGEAAVEKARYEMEEVKIREVTTAEKTKAVAELGAQQRLEVAKYARLAAAETKAEQILLGQGEAERKRLVMNADGALAQKLAAAVEMNRDNANALANRAVPATYFSGGANGSGGSYDDEMTRQLKLMNLNTIKSLGLDMKVTTK